ncbi:MAG: ParB/RepB/Spo0J family partition protein [Patescibacteria group bacterium]
MLGKGLESLIPKKSQNDDSSSGSFDDQKTDSPVGGGVGFKIENKIKDISFSEKEEERKELFQKSQEKDQEQIVKPGKHHQEAIFHIETEKIKSNPHQPRKHFDEESLKELADSIREFGIIQPLIVSKIEKETDFGTEVEYQLIAGERRLMAAKLVGLERVPVVIRRFSQKAEGLEVAIVENLQRADLNSIEVARAYAKLQDEFGLTQREVAARMGKSRETIANTLRLLNLPSEIQDALADNKINESQARMLLVVDDHIAQKKLFEELLNKGLTVRELRSRIRRAKPNSESQKEEAGGFQDEETHQLEEKLEQTLGTRVKIDKKNTSAGGGGKIVISFYSPEELYGIVKKLNPTDENFQ